MTQIPPLPQPPQSTDPANFDPRADAFLGALPGFAAAANQQADENNKAARDAAASSAAAAASASSARASSDLAAAAASAPPWSAATAYKYGDLVWSPISGLSYRRIVAGTTATDPSADRINWIEVQTPPVGTGPDQLPAAQHLGQLAFMDALSTTVVSRHARDSRPGDIWREYVSDTTTTLKFHGFDGIIRSRSESWT